MTGMAGGSKENGQRYLSLPVAVMLSVRGLLVFDANLEHVALLHGERNFQVVFAFYAAKHGVHTIKVWGGTMGHEERLPPVLGPRAPCSGYQGCASLGCRLVRSRFCSQGRRCRACHQRLRESSGSRLESMKPAITRWNARSS